MFGICCVLCASGKKTRKNGENKREDFDRVTLFRLVFVPYFSTIREAAQGHGQMMKQKRPLNTTPVKENGKSVSRREVGQRGSSMPYS